MKKILLFLSFAAIAAGCSDFEEPAHAPPVREAMTRSALAAADNPYALRNVQKALDEICSEEGKPFITLHPTHYYVRFQPRDTIEYERLDSTELLLFTYPLDRMLTDEEIDLHESDTTDTGYPWFYTTVPTDFVFPEGLAHEILDDIVLETFEEGDINAGVSNNLSEPVWERVLVKTMRLSPTRASYKWRPYARITYVDDLTGETIPLEGVKVVCHHGPHWHVSYTDANGEAKTFGTFEKSVRYKIKWEDSEYWDIRDGYVGQAKTRGPESSKHWDFEISGDTKAAVYAAIHRGCRLSFYDRPLGITRPDRGRMKICAFYSKNGKVNGDFAEATGGIVHDIRIFRKSKNRVQTRWQITSTTCHELGHASHHRAVVDKAKADRILDFVFASTQLKETWARGIELESMKWLYPEVAVNDIRPDYYGNYTGIVEALLNQGLTMPLIERTVVGLRLWRLWRQDIHTLGLVDDRLVNMFFDNPYLHWAADFGNLIEGTRQIFPNVEVTYSLPSPEFLPYAIKIASWSVSGTGHTVVRDDRTNRSITLRFATVGARTLTARLKLIDGTDYEVTKRINVTPPRSIAGKAQPQTGVPTTYRMMLYSGTVDEWEFEGLTEKDYWVQSRTSNSIKVVFRRGCTTTLKAKLRNTVLAEKQLTVPADAALVDLLAYKCDNAPLDFVLAEKKEGIAMYKIYNKGFRTLEPSSSPMHFTAYKHRPSSTHPNYSDLMPIYRNGFHHDKYTYEQSSDTDLLGNGPVFWVFSSQKEGTVPLYSIEDSEYDDKKMVTTIRYLTRENLPAWRDVTSWYWGFLGISRKDDRDWKERKNRGIVGFVYPYGGKI